MEWIRVYWTLIFWLYKFCNSEPCREPLADAFTKELHLCSLKERNSICTKIYFLPYALIGTRQNILYIVQNKPLVINGGCYLLLNL